MLISEYTILPLSLAFKVLTVEFQSESIPSALKYKEYPYEHKKKITMTCIYSSANEALGVNFH